MVSEGRARLFRRKDAKFLVYLPKDFAEDSGFPFQFGKGNDSMPLKATFDKQRKQVILSEMPEATD